MRTYSTMLSPHSPECECVYLPACVQERHRDLLQQAAATTPATGDASPLPPPPTAAPPPPPLSVPSPPPSPPPSVPLCDPYSQRLSLLRFFNDTGGQQWVNSSGWPEGIVMHLPRMTRQDLEKHMTGNRTFGNKTFGPEGMEVACTLRRPMHTGMPSLACYTYSGTHLFPHLFPCVRCPAGDRHLHIFV